MPARQRPLGDKTGRECAGAPVTPPADAVPVLCSQQSMIQSRTRDLSCCGVQISIDRVGESRKCDGEGGRSKGSSSLSFIPYCKSGQGWFVSWGGKGVLIHPGSRYVPRIAFQFHSGSTDERLIQNVPAFCFPEDRLELLSRAPGKKCVVLKCVGCSHGRCRENFTFVLTDSTGTQIFGYCERLVPPSGDGQQPAGPSFPDCYCFLSYFSYFTLFTNMLSIVETQCSDIHRDVPVFLKTVCDRQFPEPGETFLIRVQYPSNGKVVDYQLTRPDDQSCSLTYVNFAPLFSTFKIHEVTAIFAALLFERRLLFTGSNLTRLSGCIHSCVAMLYPFSWQHIFIPVLPKHLIDYATAPVPFIIGVQSKVLDDVRKLPMSETEHVDLDKREVLISHPDWKSLPQELTSQLQSALGKAVAKAKKMHVIENQVIADSFRSFFVSLFWTYRGFMVSTSRGIRFDTAGWLQEQPRDFQPFLRHFTHTQMFERFMAEREDAIRLRTKVHGIFERDVSLIERQNVRASPGIRQIGSGFRRFFKSLADATSDAMEKISGAGEEKEGEAAGEATKAGAGTTPTPGAPGRPRPPVPARPNENMVPQVPGHRLMSPKPGDPAQARADTTFSDLHKRFSPHEPEEPLLWDNDLSPMTNVVSPALTRPAPTGGSVPDLLAGGGDASLLSPDAPPPLPARRRQSSEGKIPPPKPPKPNVGHDLLVPMAVTKVEPDVPGAVLKPLPQPEPLVPLIPKQSKPSVAASGLESPEDSVTDDNSMKQATVSVSPLGDGRNGKLLDILVDLERQAVSVESPGSSEFETPRLLVEDTAHEVVAPNVVSDAPVDAAFDPLSRPSSRSTSPSRQAGAASAQSELSDLNVSGSVPGVHGVELDPFNPAGRSDESEPRFANSGAASLGLNDLKIQVSGKDESDGADLDPFAGPQPVNPVMELADGGAENRSTPGKSDDSMILGMEAHTTDEEIDVVKMYRADTIALPVTTETLTVKMDALSPKSQHDPLSDELAAKMDALTPKSPPEPATDTLAAKMGPFQMKSPLEPKVDALAAKIDAMAARASPEPAMDSLAAKFEVLSSKSPERPSGSGSFPESSGFRTLEESKDEVGKEESKDEAADAAADGTTKSVNSEGIFASLDPFSSTNGSVETHETGWASFK